MITYELIFQPDARLAFTHDCEPQLTAAGIEEAIPGCQVLDPIDPSWGLRRIHLRLDGTHPNQALEDIKQVAMQLGFFVASAIVNHWAADAGEPAARWLLGDAMFETAATDSLAGVLVYAVGAVAKAVTSEQERKLEHRYEAQQLYYGWTLREIPLPQQTTRATLQPGLAYP